uniref:Cell division protease ftsH-like protein, chloroplastic n=1 Tax=Aegilops tauschii TaxID=37682 RepID=M8AZK4_AEGTA
MAPPSLSSSHLLITASLPKPSSIRPPRLPVSSRPVPALLLALAASPAFPALAVDAPAPLDAAAPQLQLQAEAPTPAANPFADTLLTAPKPGAGPAAAPAGWAGPWTSAAPRASSRRCPRPGSPSRTSPAPTRPSSSCRRSSTSSRTPTSTPRSGPRSPRAACSSARPGPGRPRRAQGGPGGGPGGMGGPMDFGRSKSKFQEVPETGVTFQDVAGADQAKLELQEVVDFLKNPDKYTALGAKIPKGCLLVGPPGTGKTLLARAVAGEAGVPFFSCAASEFVELFVGVGASRVRDLFEKAKAKAPCIVFIDEIDAVGRQRGAGMGGGNDEREQTINQLLTEMDGFSGNSGVIVLAATNRPDVLDSALLRPGRFDRQVTVDRPDVAGRVRILEVHSRGKALAKDVDFDKVARRTPGFTGADLQNLMNEAAILAARRDLKEISKDEISDALERIIAGPEKKNAVVSEQKRKLVAYHEAGHALVGALMPEYDPVAKISIIPRGQAGGLTFFAPSEERLESGLYSRSYLENQMAVALGGRVAEEVIFGQDNVTTGASSDFMQVSRVARQMVERFGFSKKIGQVAIGSSGGGNPFLGQQMSSQKDYSMATADIVDAEVRELVETAYSRATQIINTHIDILHRLANLLIEKETVDGEEFMSLFIDGQAELFVA